MSRYHFQNCHKATQIKQQRIAEGTWYDACAESRNDQILAAIRKCKWLVRCRSMNLSQQRMFFALLDMQFSCTSGADIREQFHCSRASADQVAAAYDEWKIANQIKS